MAMTVKQVEDQVDAIVTRCARAKGITTEKDVSEFTKLQTEYKFLPRDTDNGTRAHWRERLRGNLLDIERLTKLNTSNPARFEKIEELEDEAAMWTRKIKRAEAAEDSEDEE